MFEKKNADAVERLLKEVGAFQRDRRGRVTDADASEKSLNQLVSSVDLQSEEQLVNGLSALLPEAGFLTEEGTAEKQAALKWVIDPLDGTTNFLFGLEHFAISVALMDGNEVLFGAIYLPEMNRYFSAWGNGAFCNGEQIRISSRSTFAPSLIATGFPYYTFDGLDNYLYLLQYFMRHTKGVRRMGSAATDLAYTAAGHFDLFFEMNLSPWDVAAGSFIVQQAGGKVCGFEGRADHLFGPSIVAGNPALVEKFLEIWAVR